MKKLILATALIPLLIGCKQTTDTAQTRQLSGLVTMFHEAHTFTPCDALENAYWIIDSTGAIYKNTQRLEPRPTRALVATLNGYTKPNDGSIGLAEGYDSVFVVTSIVDIEAKNFRNVCIPYDFWILGNEPFFSIQISKAENLIEMITPETDKTLSWAWVAPTLSDNSWTYTLSGSSNAKISIYKESCSDTMSDKIYSYKAEVMIDGVKYSACAMDYSQGRSDIAQ